MPTNLLSEVTGLTLSSLEKATASPADVVSGKTFYSGSKTLQTGILDTRTFIAFGKVWCSGGFHPFLSYNPDYVDVTQNRWSISYTYTFKKACNIYLNSVSYTDRGASGQYWRCTIKKNADTVFTIGPYASGASEYPYASFLQMNIGDTITIERNSDSEGSTIDMIMYTTP